MRSDIDGSILNRNSLHRLNKFGRSLNKLSVVASGMELMKGLHCGAGYLARGPQRYKQSCADFAPALLSLMLAYRVICAARDGGVFGLRFN